MQMLKWKKDDVWVSCKKPTDLWEISTYHDKGGRPTMEDSCCIKEQILGNQSFSLLLGVFDGHSGDRCSQYLSKELPDEIGSHPKFGKDDGSTCDAMKEAFFNVEKRWLDKARAKKMEDGSTALCIVVLNNMLYVANTGDCRAVMCRGGVPVILTKDHKPEVPEEKERIEKRGGFVIGGRVQGQLGVSRSFGDYQFKLADDPTNNYLDCEPEVNMQLLTPDTEFIVIGCDGLYDELSNEAIVDYVKKKLEEKQTVEIICQGLVREALECGSKDNVTVIIVKFEKKFKKKLQMAMKQKESCNQRPGLLKSAEIRRDKDKDKDKSIKFNSHVLPISIGTDSQSSAKSYSKLKGSIDLSSPMHYSHVDQWSNEKRHKTNLNVVMTPERSETTSTPDIVRLKHRLNEPTEGDSEEENRRNSGEKVKDESPIRRDQFEKKDKEKNKSKDKDEKYKYKDQDKDKDKDKKEKVHEKVVRRLSAKVQKEKKSGIHQKLSESTDQIPEPNTDTLLNKLHDITTSDKSYPSTNSPLTVEAKRNKFKNTKVNIEFHLQEKKNTVSPSPQLSPASSKKEKRQSTDF